MTQANVFTQFGKSEHYFQAVRSKYVGMDTKIGKYKKDFLTKFQNSSETVFSQDMSKAIETIKLDLDLILLQVTEDLKFMQLPQMGTSLITLFDVFATIQNSLLRRNRLLAELNKTYKKKCKKKSIIAEEYEKLNQALCHVCSRNIEQAKLKNILPITTYATHEMQNKQTETNILEEQIKRLDLENFYGSDRNELMRKITQLLNDKSVSLNRKPAETEHTLKAFLQQLFQKSPQIQLSLLPFEETQEQNQQQLQKKNEDIVNSITAAVREDLLKSVGAPLKNYIQIMSQWKLRQMLLLRQNQRTTREVQTTDFKSIEHIRILECRVKSINHELVSRRMRTQQVEKELIEEIIEVDKCKRRIGELEKINIDLKEAIKLLQSNKLQHQSQLQKVHQEKLQQISKVQSDHLEQVTYLKKQIARFISQIENLNGSIRERCQQQITKEDMAIQTVFVRHTEATQTPTNIATLTNTLNENMWPKSSLKNKSGLIDQQTSRSIKGKKNVTLKQSPLRTPKQQTDSDLSKTNGRSTTKQFNKSQSSPKHHTQRGENSFKKQIKRKRIIIPVKKSINTAKILELNKEIQPLPQRISQKDIEKSNDKISIKNLPDEEDSLASSVYSNITNNGSDDECELDKNKLLKEMELFKAIIQYNTPQKPRQQSLIKDEKDKQNGRLNTSKSQDPMNLAMQKLVIKKLGKDLLKKRSSKRHGKLAVLKRENVFTQPAEQVRGNRKKIITSRRNINDEVDALKPVLLKEFDFLDRIGIITLLEKLKEKQAPKREINICSKVKKQQQGANLLKTPKLDYPLNAQLPIKFCNSDLQLFGGYKGAVKYVKNKGIYSNDILSFDNHSPVINLIVKMIDGFNDVKSSILLKNFIVNPISTVLNGIVDQQVKSDAVKLGLKKIFRFHSHCKPKCNHVWSFLNKFGISQGKS